MVSRSDGSKPPDWTGWPPANNPIPIQDSDSEFEPEIFSNEISELIQNENNNYSDLPSLIIPEINRWANQDVEREIREQQALQEERQNLRFTRLRRTYRQLRLMRVVSERERLRTSPYFDMHFHNNEIAELEQMRDTLTNEIEEYQDVVRESRPRRRGSYYRSG